MGMLRRAGKALAGRGWLDLSDRRYRLRQYFVLYTALFAAVCGLAFSWYLLAGRTFIWQEDGWQQHYRALVYYAKYLRAALRELLQNHRLVLPMWEHALGEGNDILQTLHYYVIGDPFAALSVLVPTRFLWVYYDLMILLRLYLAGVVFSHLCFYTQKGIGRYAVMAGALSYVFCYWAILNVNRHPYFLNPLLYYPLILLGIEKLLNRERPYLLILSVFLAAVSNFYYFYVIVLMTVAYVAVRLLTEYRTDFKSMLAPLARIAGASALGTVMGGVILLPMVVTFLGDARMDAGISWRLVYPLSYYSRLLRAVFAGDGSYWLCMGYAAPVVLAVFLLFLRRREHRLLKACFLVCWVIILVPALGQLLNGMSYRSNKWSWALALLCAYILAVMWPGLMALRAKEALGLAACLAVCFFGLLMLEYSRTTAAFAGMGFAFLFLLWVFPIPRETPQEGGCCGKTWRQAVALVLVVLSIANVSFFKNAPLAGDYAGEAMEAETVTRELMRTEAAAVQKAAKADGETGFYRYSGRGMTRNGGLLSGVSGTPYFWSISNPAMSEFRRAMELRESKPQQYEGYDDSAALLALSAVKYYAAPTGDQAPVPYGFTPTEVKKNGYRVYRNENPLPLAYTYDAVMSRAGWDALSAVERQEAMLQAVVLEGYDGETGDAGVARASRSLDYAVQCNGAGATLEDYGFVVTSANSSVTLHLEGPADSEMYFVIHGLAFDGAGTYELYFGDGKYDPLDLFSQTRWEGLSHAEREAARRGRLFWTEPTGAKLTLKTSSGLSKTVQYNTEEYSWYADRHDFTVNLGYAQAPVTDLTLTFSAVGVYSFDAMEVICRPMDRYAEQVAALGETALEDVELGVDTVEGTIALDRPKVLCFSIPYSAGWTACVDGERATLYRANLRHMALVLEPGEHRVKLTYQTPYLRAGAAASAVGLLGFAGLLAADGLKKRKGK